MMFGFVDVRDAGMCAANFVQMDNTNCIEFAVGASVMYGVVFSDGPGRGSPIVAQVLSLAYALC